MISFICFSMSGDDIIPCIYASTSSKEMCIRDSMETEQPAVVRGTSGESVIKAPIALTVDMFSANATEPSEGSLAALVDDNINTYYHTIWSEMCIRDSFTTKSGIRRC